ncbi:MAG: hypothetical protein PVI97_11575 [Candidatus Thiodiazotropha sp.]|jgi:hypothetical protein
MKSRIGIILISLLLVACSDTPLSPQEQLRNILSEAEVSLEARQLTSVMAYVDPGYQDKSGRDFRALKAMLLGYFMRHKSIHILSKVDEIVLHTDNEAHVVLFAGLAGNPQEKDMPLSQWRGDLLRLQLQFSRSDDDWLLQTAEWRRASPQDFAF